MRHFIYMIGDFTKNNIHLGDTTDMGKMLKYYGYLNETSLHWPVEHYLNRLVYLEEGDGEFLTKDRCKILSTLTSKEKREMILEINPNWDDLAQDKNFQEFIQTGV